MKSYMNDAELYERMPYMNCLCRIQTLTFAQFSAIPTSSFTSTPTSAPSLTLTITFNQFSTGL